MKVTWKIVKGCEDYEVSDTGKVRRITPASGTQPGRILKAQPCRGYLYIKMRKNRKKIAKFVHVLVAEAFLGPCPPHKEVNHKDLNKKNCGIDNLEYITHKQNVKNAIRNGHYSPPPVLDSEESPFAKLNWKSVIFIRKEFKKSSFGEWEFARAICDEFSTTPKTIVSIIRRRTWKRRLAYKNNSV